MDSEEHEEIQKAIQNGHSTGDEGPYYHGSWWESYKGSVKGKLGGVVIGAAVGIGVGILAAGGLALAATGLTFGVAAAIAGGFGAAGAAYGAHEFSDVGKVTGAVAAAHEKAEQRMKSFESGKFAELKKDISDLKALITGQQPDPAVAAEAAKAQAEAAKTDYQTTHAGDKSNGLSRPIFWKIAAIGLAIGLAVGALLTFGGVTGHLLHLVGAAAGPLEHAGGQYIAAMATMGLFGASFGVNRDIFRGIFDKTDHAFKGFPAADGPAPQQAAGIAQATEVKPEKSADDVTTVVYESHVDYPQSDTHHRDKVLAQAKQALLSMDHTKAIPH